ncbi:MAG TPA: 4a-hydroxytetrahydrobiopterin dehydratase [Casimicrobiaceae bacterium]|jgi:4a-hydroxytetrahydrobiopterin dehydratase
MSSELAALSALSCRAGAPLLAVTEVMQHLKALPAWEYADGRLIKIFRFANYYETMAFVNAVAYVAHREDHHPDLSVHYNRAVASYSTHDAGGVTLNDCICAAKIEALIT